MKQVMKTGVTDRTVTVFIPDPASTDGSGKTGLVAADLTVSYVRVETDNDVTVTDVTSSLNNLSTLTDAHNDWGLLQISSTVAPGLYRLDIADAVFASGAWSAVVYVMITSSAAAASPMEFILVAYDQLDGVRLGLTALPNAAADAAGGLPISDAGGLDLDAKIGALTFGTANRVNAQVYGMEANTVTATAIAADAITDAKVASDVTIASVTGAVGSVTGNVGGNVTGSVGSLAAQAKADVNAEVDTALSDIRLDELLNADSDIDGAAPPTVGSVFHELMTKTTGSFTYDQTTDSLEAVRDRGDSAWTTATGFSTLDAAGVRSAVGLASANLDTQLDALPTTAEVNAEVDTALSDVGLTTTITGRIDAAISTRLASASYTAPDNTSITAIKTVTDKLDDTLEDDAGTFRFTTNALEQAPTGGSAPTAADIADAVWEEAIADHSGTTGSTAEALAAAGSAGDPWATALPGAYGSGTAGKIIGDNLDAAISTRATQSSVDTIDNNVDSILVDTAEIGAAGAGLSAIPWNAAWDAEVQSEATDALNAYDPPTKAELDSAVAPLATDANLATVAGYVDTEVGAIKAVTDKLDDTLEDDGGTFRFTTNALEQAPSGSGASAADIADAVWDEATADHTTAGTTGKAITDAQSSGDPWATEFDGMEAGEILTLLAAYAAGKTTVVKIGNKLHEVTFRAIDDSADRIVATVNNSQRTAVTLTP